jgi:hypothetical protein
MFDEEIEAEAIMLESGESVPGAFYDPIKNYEMRGRNNSAIDDFLGKGHRSVEALSTAGYYGKLLAWAVKCLTTSSGWKVVSATGYSSETPVFRDIANDYTKNESCMVNGLLLLEKEGVRLVITIAASFGLIEIEANEEHLDLTKKVTQDIADFLKENNFYRGKKISYNGEISFLDAGQIDFGSL